MVNLNKLRKFSKDDTRTFIDPEGAKMSNTIAKHIITINDGVRSGRDMKDIAKLMDINVRTAWRRYYGFYDVVHMMPLELLLIDGEYKGPQPLKVPYYENMYTRKYYPLGYIRMYTGAHCLI